MPGWNEPETAPLGEKVILAVTDGQGEPPYLLQSPCKRTADGWISSKNGTRMLVMPVKWRRYAKRRRERSRARGTFGEKVAKSGPTFALSRFRMIALRRYC